MKAFNKLPGSVRATSGLEQRVWRRLPALLLWGTLLPLLLVGWNHLGFGVTHAKGVLQWDYMMWGVVMLHWTLVLTLAIGCFIVRVMKGPAYVADPYLLANDINVASSAQDDRP
jgi:hypothetical protein